MKVFFPSYYSKFKCIADRCRHSCCVGWEIGVDSATMEKYRAMGDESILSHLDCDEIKMTPDGRCPFLRADGLCRLIADYGEDFISEICREHPRFYHRVGDRFEMGIGASCEEAARLILSSDYAEFSYTDEEFDRLPDTSFDTLSHREQIYALLSGQNLTFGEKLQKITSEYEIEDALADISFWNEALSGLELLDEGHRDVISLGRIGENSTNQLYYERFFAYLLFRHLSVAESYDNLRARLAFCILLTKILWTNTVDGDFDKILDTARVISEEIEYSEDNTADLIFELECRT